MQLIFIGLQTIKRKYQEYLIMSIRCFCLTAWIWEYMGLNEQLIQIQTQEVRKVQRPCFTLDVKSKLLTIKFVNIYHSLHFPK